MRATASPFDRFADHLDRALAAGSSAKLLMEGGEAPLTYGELADRMRRANALFVRMGLKPGDRAAIFSADDRDTVTLFFAMLRAGITPVLGDGRAAPDEMAALLRIARPAALFADRALLAANGGILPVLAGNILQTGPADGGNGARGDFPSFGAKLSATAPRPWRAPLRKPETALIVFTSGTTSEPKGVMLTYANLLAQLAVFGEIYGFDAETRLLNTRALHHVDGMIRGPLAALWFGGTVLRPAHAGAAAMATILRAVRGMAATHFIAVPALLGVVLRLRLGETDAEAFRTPHFRFVICSADHLEESLWQRFEETFGVQVVNAYGLSEVVCDALFSGPGANSYRRGTLGRPAGCEARVLREDGSEAADGEAGELLLRGPAIMAGYFNAPEASAAVLTDGWFRTGDFVRRGPDGFFTFVGRKKTRIVSAGVTIHPEAISAVLLTMPGVAEAVTFGMADPVRGQKVVSCVVPEPGAALTVAGIGQFCARHLSPERVPAAIHLLSELPRGSAGKVSLDALSAVLRESAEAQAPSEPVTVYELAAECFNVPEAMLSADSTPFNTDGWDSLSHVALIESIEQAFGFQMSAMDIAMFASLGDAERIVAERKPASDDSNPRDRTQPSPPNQGL